ncbi:hypothetical protein AA13594_3008 [Gluconacetobacter azotocaptans DSM 13594]|nr:hypothetical protein AA13594_3008 [Gluconacetobacter azotocaptans DSM 13594]
MDASNGQALDPIIHGGTLDGAQAVGGVGNGVVLRTLAKHFNDLSNVLDFGAGPGAVDSSSSFLGAYTSSGFPIVYIPYFSGGYRIDNIIGSSSRLLYTGVGSLRNDNVGISFLNGNVISGAGVGTPSTGHGTFNATYTNPWNVTTNLKMEFDPAAIPSAGQYVTYQGLSVECLPERPNNGDAVANHRGIACVYRGADTGTGGGTGTAIGTEVDNDVLNLNTNSGNVDEIDLNVNGRVADGGISRGLFITGGGVDGLTCNCVALDIQHGSYGGIKPILWGTGISIRSSVQSLQMYKTTASEGGSFVQAYDENGNTSFIVDKNGYVGASGLTLTKNYTPNSTSSCKKGRIMADDNYIYVCTSSGTYKRVALSAISD